MVILKASCSWWTVVIIGILVPCNAKICLIKCMWDNDLHFMVQWFCLISWRLFDGWTFYWRYWFSVIQTLTLNYICRSVTYISWSSDFALYLENYLMDKCHNWNIGSMWCKDLPHKMYVGQWTTFHGPVILSYILKMFWWRNVALKILCDMGHWPVFHDLTILNHLPVSRLPIVVCWYENICEFSKVRNRPVVYSRHEVGHPCTLDTF